MAHDMRIVVACPDRPGVLAAIASRLYDLGADFGDTSFAVLGEAAEFTAICRLPDDIDGSEIARQLSLVPELAQAAISATPFSLGAQRLETGRETHVVEVEGVDQPGLVARLAEAFADFGANIVRMSTERVSGGVDGQYRIRFEVWLPPERAQTCLAAVGNTAQELGLAWRSQSR